MKVIIVTFEVRYLKFASGGEGTCSRAVLDPLAEAQAVLGSLCPDVELAAGVFGNDIGCHSAVTDNAVDPCGILSMLTESVYIMEGKEYGVQRIDTCFRSSCRMGRLTKELESL